MTIKRLQKKKIKNFPQTGVHYKEWRDWLVTSTNFRTEYQLY